MPESFVAESFEAGERAVEFDEQIDGADPLEPVRAVRRPTPRR